MAGQRRGESRRDGGGRRPGARRLALLLTLAVLAGCGEDPRGVGPLEPGDDQGTGGGNNPTAELLGTWRNVTAVEVPGDLQTWTTTWTFGDDATCRQTVETESLAEGVPRTTDRGCQFTVASDEVTISYVGGGTAVFHFFFAGFDPDRLVLDGFEYARLAA